MEGEIGLDYNPFRNIQSLFSLFLVPFRIKYNFLPQSTQRAPSIYPLRALGSRWLSFLNISCIFLPFLVITLKRHGRSGGSEEGESNKA